MNDNVRFLELTPGRNRGETRDRSNGRYYTLTAIVNSVQGKYRIQVQQSVMGVEDGKVLFDFQFENTGGLVPYLGSIEKTSGNLCNGEYDAIEDEWLRQYYTDPELLVEAGKFYGKDFVESIKDKKAKYLR